MLEGTSYIACLDLAVGACRTKEKVLEIIVLGGLVSAVFWFFYITLLVHMPSDECLSTPNILSFNNSFSFFSFWNFLVRDICPGVQ